MNLLEYWSKIAFEYANDSILNAYFPHFKSVISPIWCPKSAMRLLHNGGSYMICILDGRKYQLEIL